MSPLAHPDVAERGGARTVVAATAEIHLVIAAEAFSTWLAESGPLDVARRSFVATDEVMDGDMSSGRREMAGDAR